MDVLETVREHYEQRDLAARRWKAQGGRVVGYVSDDVPEELILAAGLFPFRMSGDPREGVAEAEKYTESFYDPSVRSILNMLLTGKYDFLDFMIIPHHSDAVLKLFHQMWWINRLNPEIVFPPVHLFDILHTRFLSTGLFVRKQVEELKEKIEEWSGREVDRASLLNAIRTVNENRRLLGQIAALRNVSPSRLAGTDALRLVGTSGFMLKGDHNKLLKEFLATSHLLPERDGMRLFVEGSDLDNLQLYEIIESCGGNVVAEESSWGNGHFRDLVDEEGDPLEAIADRYHLRPSRYRIQSLDERVRSCLKGVTESKAEAVIFFLLEWDPARAWDQPEQQKALREKGIKTLHFEAQKYDLSEARAGIRTQVERLLESMGTESGRR
ncbi:MAG TPA: 2-hydroxyacyl-CoA dehydratase family protein [Syntrophorhabdales bacterium]|nr:2-hydroxyacyl-CoA dehydratase family protein [Syntrophorhabdales bacterium]